MSEAHHEIASDPTLERALGGEERGKQLRYLLRASYTGVVRSVCRLFINRAKSLSPGHTLYSSYINSM